MLSSHTKICCISFLPIFNLRTWRLVLGFAHPLVLLPAALKSEERGGAAAEWEAAPRLAATVLLHHPRTLLEISAASVLRVVLTSQVFNRTLGLEPWLLIFMPQEMPTVFVTANRDMRGMASPDQSGPRLPGGG